MFERFGTATKVNVGLGAKDSSPQSEYKFYVTPFSPKLQPTGDSLFLYPRDRSLRKKCPRPDWDLRQ
jgi:hypothetical protein